MKHLKIAALLALIAVAVSAAAMEQEGGIRLILGDPAGEFGDTIDDPGFGLALHYGVRPQPAWTFGIGLDAMTYGSETREYDLPLVEDFELKTDNNVAGGFLFAQWRPMPGVVQPYVEARAGINYFWTESKLEDEDWWDDDEVGRETNMDDFATFWGAGGGLQIRLSRGGGSVSSPGVLLDFKVLHLEGAEAEYLTEGAITVDGDDVEFDSSTSRTDLTTYELGVVLAF